MKNTSCILFVLLLIVFSPEKSFAQAPTRGINYQAALISTVQKTIMETVLPVPEDTRKPESCSAIANR
ncbi:MAG: hypothetical protein M3R17_19150 [Bacteroidota bacterium]|nr:hypothetical protein [Bacteroidota bacterium]